MVAKRIQRKRAKGWRMPADAVYVGRPTKWGNRWKVGDDMPLTQSLHNYTAWLLNDPDAPDVAELKGKDLACWCSLDQPCHADVLLALANG